MASTILPGNKNAVFPITPTDGQQFIDADRVRWIFNAETDVWEKVGVVADLPRADATTIGVMSAQDKALLDRVPAVGGGFGIVVDTKLLLQSPTNTEGVIRGDIQLKSESLDITCVDANRVVLTCPVPPALECGVGNPPALLFKLSDKFLDTFIVNRPGPQGKKGLKGETGDQGPHGYSPGPVGDKGAAGEDVTELCDLVTVEYQDIDGLTDTSIVNMQLLDDNGHGCKLVVTKSKLNVPENLPADQVSGIQIQRAIIYPEDNDPAACDVSRLADWELTKPIQDDYPIDVNLLRLPKSANTDGLGLNLNGTMTLSQFVTDIVSEYSARLQKIDQDWGTEVRNYIQNIDDKARMILSDLANELAMCEFNLPATDFCITLENCENPPSPSAAAASRAGHTLRTLSNQQIANVRMGRKEWRVSL